MKYIIPYTIIVVVCMAVAVVNARILRRAADDLHQISEDINAIRKTLEPKPITFGVEPPPFRARVDFRENAHQEPEVTLL